MVSTNVRPANGSGSSTRAIPTTSSATPQAHPSPCRTGSIRVARLGGYAGHELSLYRDLVFTTGLADDHRIWMSGAAALFLIGRDGSIRRVSDHGGVPVNSCS